MTDVTTCCTQRRGISTAAQHSGILSFSESRNPDSMLHTVSSAARGAAGGCNIQQVLSEISF